MFRRFHVILKIARGFVGLIVDRLVVNQRSDRSFACIDLRANGFQIARGLSNVLHRILSGVEYLTGFADHVRDFERRLTSNGVSILNLLRIDGPERNLDILVAQESFRFYRGHRILLDDIPGRALQTDYYRNLSIGCLGKIDALYGALANPSNPDIGAFVQAGNILELGLHHVSRRKTGFLVADVEHSEA